MIMTSKQDVQHNGSPINNMHNKRNDCLVLAILDLTIGSIVNIDGSSIVLQRDDFVGIHSIPKTVIPDIAKPIMDRSIFHMVTIRGGTNGSKANTSIGASIAPAMTTGFLLCAHEMDDSVIARRYDPYTEEVSSQSMDDLTIRNLIDKVHNNQIDPQRFISYRDVTSNVNDEIWYEKTNFITNDFLKKVKKLQHGSKVIPGSFEFDSVHDEVDAHRSGTNDTGSCVDGIAINYPPIPVFTNDKHGKHFSVDTTKTVSACRHLGTRRFLQSLSPSLRTSYCFATDGADPANEALTYIVKASYEERWEYFLGDLQLSFVMFLHLHCYTSYNFWRDVVAMISVVDENGLTQHMNMYDALFDILSVQIQSIDNVEGVFDDIDLSDDEFFLLPSLQQLLSTANRVAVNFNPCCFSTSLLKLKTAIQTKFSLHTDKIDALRLLNDCRNCDAECSQDDMECGTASDNNEDDEVPMIVSAEEIEESRVRSQVYMHELNQYYHTTDLMQQHDRKLLSKHYPLLLAAMDSSSGKDDIMMTCARALHDAVDVSLVREAAAYLEDVELKKIGN